MSVGRALLWPWPLQPCMRRRRRVRRGQAEPPPAPPLAHPRATPWLLAQPLRCRRTFMPCPRPPLPHPCASLRCRTPLWLPYSCPGRWRRLTVLPWQAAVAAAAAQVAVRLHRLCQALLAPRRRPPPRPPPWRRPPASRMRSFPPFLASAAPPSHPGKVRLQRAHAGRHCWACGSPTSPAPPSP